MHASPAATNMSAFCGLFRKKCNVCQVERSSPDASQASSTLGCSRADDPSSDKKEFLPAPLAHYCCVCAKQVGWSKFEKACLSCKQRLEQALQDAESEKGTNEWLTPICQSEQEREQAQAGCGRNEDGEDFYVKIGWCFEGAKEEEEEKEKKQKLAAVQQECEEMRAAAIQQATREAEEAVARILGDAQASARQQAAEEREALIKEAHEDVKNILEEGKAAAREQLDRVLSEASKILDHATLAAESIVEEARTSVAPAGAWVEVGVSGSAGWHRPGMAVFFRGELAAATRDFGDDYCVGAGGFGSVFRADHLQGLGNGAPMAVKRLDPASMQGQGEFLQELQVLGACRHEHLLPVLGFAADGERAGEAVCLVTPLMLGGNLEDRLAASRGDIAAKKRLLLLAAGGSPGVRHPPLQTLQALHGGSRWGPRTSKRHRGCVWELPWQVRVRCIVALLRALVYLHTPDATRCKPAILHRDIKPANLLLDASGNARLSDVGLAQVYTALLLLYCCFTAASGNAHLSDVGLAQILKPTKTHVTNSMLAGTHGFIDPHYSQTGKYDASADGFAVAVTMLMALTGCPPYDANETLVDRCCRANAGQIADVSAKWPQHIADTFLRVANGLARSPRRDRISVREALGVLEALCLDHRLQVFEAANASDTACNQGEVSACVMCMCRPRQVRFGCGHRLLCEGCLRYLLARDQPSCPCCLQAIEEDLVVADYMLNQLPRESHPTFTPSQLRIGRFKDMLQLACPPRGLSELTKQIQLPWQ